MVLFKHGLVRAEIQYKNEIFKVTSMSKSIFTYTICHHVYIHCMNVVISPVTIIIKNLIVITQSN